MDEEEEGGSHESTGTCAVGGECELRVPDIQGSTGGKDERTHHSFDTLSRLRQSLRLVEAGRSSVIRSSTSTGRTAMGSPSCCSIRRWCQGEWRWWW